MNITNRDFHARAFSSTNLYRVGAISTLIIFLFLFSGRRLLWLGERGRMLRPMRRREAVTASLLRQSHSCQRWNALLGITHQGDWLQRDGVSVGRWDCWRVFLYLLWLVFQRHEKVPLMFGQIPWTKIVPRICLASFVLFIFLSPGHETCGAWFWTKIGL